jgi:hypothetical protein
MMGFAIELCSKLWRRFTGSRRHATRDGMGAAARDAMPAHERAIVAVIGAHAPIAAGFGQRREPADFLLAARLHSVSVLNPPAARGTKRSRATAVPAAKKQRAGLLSPVLARGTVAASA